MTKNDSEGLKAPAGGFKMRRVHPGLTLAETIREHGLIGSRPGAEAAGARQSHHRNS